MHSSGRRGSIRPLIQLLLLQTLLLTSGLCTSATAQIFPAPGPPPGRFIVDPGEFSPTRRLPKDPLAQTAFVKAAEAISSGDIVEGLQTLQEMIDQDADFFVSDDRSGRNSLLGRAEKLFQTHNEDYERLYGPTARQLLSSAKAEQNFFQLEEIVRRFSMTSAGAAALQELARQDRDRGEPAKAARLLQQLAEHPQTSQPRPILMEAVRLLTFNGDRTSASLILQNHAELFPDAKENESLLKSPTRSPIASSTNARQFEWRIPFGSANHTGQSGIAPAFGDSAWTASLVDDTYDFWLVEAPSVAQRLGEDTRQLMQATEQQIRSNTSRIAMPAASPLVVGNLVIAAGPGSVKAFDLNTGELVWNGLITDETFDYLSKWSYSAGESQDPVRDDMRNLFAATRGWRDLTSCAISSDGQRVYAVTGCQLVGTTSPQRMMQNSQRHPLLPQRSNRLIAYDIATEGKIVWPLGTNLTAAPNSLPGEPKEIFFLGAPLPVDGHLYVLGEERGQIQLFELDPATGSILWSVGLLNPDRDLVLDDARRLSGLTPAYSEGLLICPTGEGTLTAVDPVKRQVVWTHFYSAMPTPFQTQAFMLRVVRPQNQAASQSRDELLSDQRWFDSRIMIAGPYVVYTPPDNDMLVVVNLNDGNPVLKERFERGQNLYAATIYENQLILVGRSEISCLPLGGASPLWNKPVPIPAPSGRGIHMGNQFLQPLITGEIAVIDLPTGRLLTRLPTESESPPGNLISGNGRLITQTASNVAASQSLELLDQEIANRLKSNAVDPEGLALRGALALQQGRTEAGLADLKSSLATSAPPLAQSALVWSLLDGLRTDFAAYRSEAEQLEPKLQGNEQRLQFLKIFANGLQNSGEYAAAFTDQLKILRLLTWPEVPQDLDGNWRVTDSCWSLASLEQILSKVDAGTRQQLLQQLNDWAETAPPELLLHLLPSMPAEWIRPEIVLKQLSAAPASSSEPQAKRRTVIKGTAHQREALLRPLLKNSAPEIRAAAAAQLLLLARAADDLPMTLQMLEFLEKNPGIPRTEPEQSTTDLVAATRADTKFQEQLNSVIEWPMPIHVGEQIGAVSRTSLTQIPRLGPPSAALEGWTFFLDQPGGHIEIFDPQGRHCTRVSAGYPGVRYAVETDLARYVVMHNHLAAVVLLDRFILLDFLTDPAAPQLIVNRSITEEGDPMFSGRTPFSGTTRVGLRTPIVEIRPGKMSGNISALTDSRVCYTAGSDLIAINPVNGEELWRRRDVPPGSEVLADQEFILVKPPEEALVRVYRALDGQFLTSRSLPMGALNSLDRAGGDWGRFIPAVTSNDTHVMFKLHDPATEQVIWEYQAPVGTKWSVVNGQALAFATPDQQLTVIDGLTGQTEFQARIPTMETFDQFTLLKYPDEWVLLTNARMLDAIRRQPFGMRLQELVHADVSGLVCGLAKDDGRVLWSKKINNTSVITQLPHEWPILYFARGRGRMETLVLNRFTGEEISRGSANDDGTGVSWITETKPLRLNLKAGQDRITLYFGEAPPPSKRPTLPVQSEAPGR